ncbi:MAG: metallophosphoesterase family protein [Methylococcaceae bacterium]|nr:metallophosphoesterase family protein [Methylococcaceae bacterium]
MRLGIISDTHGLVRPQAMEILAGSDWILHAGDIGKAEVLNELSSLAPLSAVRGNVDRGGWAQSLPSTEVLEIAHRWIYLIHDLDELDLDPAAAGFEVVICGHSHRPKIDRRGGVLYFNPGSAGPRRFKLPISLGLIEIEGPHLEARIMEIEA